MLLAAGDPTRLGVDAALAAFAFAEEPGRDGAWHGRRLAWLGGSPAFELTFWCGTCPIAFQRLDGANETLSIPELEGRLGEGLDGLDPEVLAAMSQLVPAGDYLPMLLRIEPTLVQPGGDGDYFSAEQVSTWGIDAFWGLPNSPRVPYYRAFQTAVADDAHLYEFVVPMVPPMWNDRARVADHATRLATSSRPTALAVSILDVAQPAMDNASADYHGHWALTHFLLDGHHKMEAAAATGRSVQLLSLLSIDASLARAADVHQIPVIRSRSPGRRAEQRA